MPIQINLLAEDQAAEELRRKDPVKRSFWVGGFFVFLVLLWALSIFLKTTIARLEVSALEAKWRGMEQAVKQVEADRKATAEIGQKLSALAQFTTNRFLWANAMNALQQTCVDNVQLIRLKTEQVYIQSEAPKTQAGPGGAPVAPKAGPSVERIVVHVDGRDFSQRMAEQVPRYKDALANAPFFQSRLQKTNSVMLTSLSAPQMDTQKKSTYVVFGLQLNFQDKERRLYE